MRNKKATFLQAVEAYTEIFFNDDMTPDKEAKVTDIGTAHKRQLIEDLYKEIAVFKVFPSMNHMKLK